MRACRWGHGTRPGMLTLPSPCRAAVTPLRDTAVQCYTLSWPYTVPTIPLWSSINIREQSTKEVAEQFAWFPRGPAITEFAMSPLRTGSPTSWPQTTSRPSTPIKLPPRAIGSCCESSDSIADGESRTGEQVVRLPVQPNPGPNVYPKIFGDEVDQPAHSVVSRTARLSDGRDGVERVPLHEGL